MSEKRDLPKIAAIVVTYNRKELLSKCIEALLKQENALCDVIIWDNASTDGTDQIGAIRYRRVRYLRSKENKGCTYGITESIKVAYSVGYEAVWILDDDMEPNSLALFELVKAANVLDRWGCLSSCVYWTDGTICNSNRQKKGIFTFVQDEEYKRKSIIPVKMVSWGSMFLNLSAVKEVGLPISEFFIYTDDYEISNRVGKKYGVYVVTASAVKHYMPINKKTDLSKASSERIMRYHYLFRNDVSFYRQQGIKGWVYLIAKFVYTSAKVMMNADNKIERLRILIKGYRDGLHFKPNIEFLT